jgi:hypothetical protein
MAIHDNSIYHHKFIIYHINHINITSSTMFLNHISYIMWLKSVAGPPWRPILAHRRTRCTQWWNVSGSTGAVRRKSLGNCWGCWWICLCFGPFWTIFGPFFYFGCYVFACCALLAFVCMFTVFCFVIGWCLSWFVQRIGGAWCQGFDSGVEPTWVVANFIPLRKHGSGNQLFKIFQSWIVHGQNARAFQQKLILQTAATRGIRTM